MLELFGLRQFQQPFDFRSVAGRHTIGGPDVTSLAVAHWSGVDVFCPLNRDQFPFFGLHFPSFGTLFEGGRQHLGIVSRNYCSHIRAILLFGKDNKLAGFVTAFTADDQYDEEAGMRGRVGPP